MRGALPNCRTIVRFIGRHGLLPLDNRTEETGSSFEPEFRTDLLGDNNPTSSGHLCRRTRREPHQVFDYLWRQRQAYHEESTDCTRLFHEHTKNRFPRSRILPHLLIDDSRPAVGLPAHVGSARRIGVKPDSRRDRRIGRCAFGGQFQWEPHGTGVAEKSAEAVQDDLMPTWTAIRA